MSSDKGTQPSRFWQFIEVGDGNWVWERGNEDGTSTRVGPFNSLQECVVDARDHGFDESKLERRKVPRADPQHRVDGSTRPERG